MNNQVMREKYIGKSIKVYTPSGRLFRAGKVFDVKGENAVCFVIEGTDIETAVYLSDGIKIEIVELEVTHE